MAAGGSDRGRERRCRAASTTRVAVFASVALLGVASIARAQADDETAVAPPAPRPIVYEESDVIALLGDLSLELEALRGYFEKPRIPTPSFRIEDSHEHEAFEQAVGLLMRARRLSAEQLGEVGGPVRLPDRDDRTMNDIYRVVDAARERVERVRMAFELEVAGAGSDAAGGGAVELSASGITDAILGASRRLDSLLDVPSGTDDVYTRGADALGFATALLGKFDAGATPRANAPAAPLPDAGTDRRTEASTLVEVHAQLLASSATAAQIGERIGVALGRAVGTDEVRDVSAVDAYLLSELVLDALSRLHVAAGAGPTSLREPMPDAIRTTDLLRQATQLRATLEALDAATAAIPKAASAAR